jgi:hypothetical protein
VNSGDDFLLSDSPQPQSDPAVTYSAPSEAYFVAWSDFRSLSSYDIYGQEVSGDGGVVPSEDADVAVAPWDLGYPALASNPYTPAGLLAFVTSEGDPPVVQFGLVGEDEPDIEADESERDFGSLHTGATSAAASFVLTNTSGADLIIDDVSVTGSDADQFTIQSDVSEEVTLGWAESWTLEVVFSPTTAGIKSADIELASNDPDEDPYVLALSGEATNTVPPLPALVFPPDGQTNVSAASVTFIWDDVSDEDGDAVTHTFYLGTAEDLEGVTGVEVAAALPSTLMLAGASAGLLLAAAAAMGRRRGKAVLLLTAALCVLCLILGACRNGGPGDGDGDGTPVPVVNPEPEEGQRSRTVTGLEAATTYFWKVVVDDGFGGIVESEVRSFTTQ